MLAKMFEIDLRSLAIFRVWMGIVLIVDLLQRSLHVRDYYTDDGLLPLQGLVELFGPSIRWQSLHCYTGSNVWLQQTMLVIGIAFAVGLACGYRTWWSTAISWGLIVSLNRRMPSMAYGGDDVTRLLLFWSLFLPTGARWSVDNARHPSQIGPRYWSMATIVILMQVCSIYWFGVLLKLHPDWLWGNAVQMALELDSLVTPIGSWLAQQAGLTRALTIGTLVLEFGMPALAIFPFGRPWTRLVAVAMMVSFHLGITVCMNVGLFSWVSIAGWLLFLPTEFWDWMEARLRWPSHVAMAHRETPAPSNQYIASTRATHGAHIASLSTTARHRTSMGIVAVLGIVATAYNILGLDALRQRGMTIPQFVDVPAKLLRIDQKWTMFAPTPRFISDGWYIMPAKMMDGTLTDIWSGSDVTYAKPGNVARTFETDRQRDFLRAYCTSPDSKVWPYVVKNVVRRWNSQHPTRNIDRLQIIFIREFEHNGRIQLVPMIEYSVPLDAPVPLSAVPFGRHLESTGEQ